jgi:hypothetical protein
VRWGAPAAWKVYKEYARGEEPSLQLCTPQWAHQINTNNQHVQSCCKLSIYNQNFNKKYLFYEGSNKMLLFIKNITISNYIQTYIQILLYTNNLYNFVKTWVFNKKYTFTICFGPVWVFFFLLEKQTFNGLLKVIGIQILLSYEAILFSDMIVNNIFKIFSHFIVPKTFF